MFSIFDKPVAKRTKPSDLGKQVPLRQLTMVLDPRPVL